MAKNENDLTPLQQSVADTYLKMPPDERSAAGAYKIIKPKAKDSVAETQGPKMLRIAQVQTYITKMEAEVQEVVKKELEVDRLWVINRLLEISDRCMQVEPVRDRKGNIIEGEFQFNASGAHQSTRSIGDALGDVFVKNVNLKGNVRHSGVLRVNNEPSEEEWANQMKEQAQK